jgi:hypothetical protein
MTPENVLNRAREMHLAGIAICDHNTAGNVRAFQRAGAKLDVSVLGGMEITSREEAHVLAYMEDWEALDRLQTLVHSHLPGINDEEAFGLQILVDEASEPLGLSERLLAGACDLSLHQIVEAVHRLGGLAVAAHVDRPSFSIISQLGFLPADLAVDAVEVSPRCGDRSEFERLGKPVLVSSDAHYVHEVGGGSTVILADHVSVSEIELALRGQGGRRVEV